MQSPWPAQEFEAEKIQPCHWINGPTNANSRWNPGGASSNFVLVLGNIMRDV
jgi:hypothetical protein